MEQWLMMSTFLNKIITIELRLTFLQLVIIAIELPDALSYLTEALLHFTEK